MKSKTLGTEGFLGAVVLAIALTVIYYFTGIVRPLPANFGLCLPSPNLWPLPELWSWGINLVLILGCGIALYFFNKGYSVIQSADTVLPSMFLLLTATNPWADGLLESSSLMAAINIVCLSTIFSCYKSRNATQEVFVMATMLSLGSMFQYAFIFLMPGYILIALMMKCFRIKELAAFVMGICAPYWIAVGMGLVPLDAFHWPTFTNLFEEFSSASDLVVGGLSVGITALIAILMALNNAVKLYAGNTQRRLYNNAIAVVGITCVAGMAMDVNNLPTYLATFYITVAVQFANTFALWNIRKPSLWLRIIAAVYVIVFLIMVL
ncbi:MAG: hypothetical protein K2G23_06690 [Muribaculaceae bacterium]|nr:hypothetical protein [Muribaculaceae bacterium]